MHNDYRQQFVVYTALSSVGLPGDSVQTFINKKMKGARVAAKRCT